jgi:hypothetical protein
MQVVALRMHARGIGARSTSSIPPSIFSPSSRSKHAGSSAASDSSPLLIQAQRENAGKEDTVQRRAWHVWPLSSSFPSRRTGQLPRHTHARTQHTHTDPNSTPRSWTPQQRLARTSDAAEGATRRRLVGSLVGDGSCVGAKAWHAWLAFFFFLPARPSLSCGQWARGKKTDDLQRESGVRRRLRVEVVGVVLRVEGLRCGPANPTCIRIGGGGGRVGGRGGGGGTEWQ